MQVNGPNAYPVLIDTSKRAATDSAGSTDGGSEMDRRRVILCLGDPFFPELDNFLEFHGFQILKPWESRLTLDSFLASHCRAVRALLLTGLILVDDTLLGNLPSLGLIVTTSVGVNHIDLPACRIRGIVVAGAGDAFTDDTADYAVGLLLDVIRRVSASDRLVRGGVPGGPPLACKVSLRGDIRDSRSRFCHT